jgi:hypothetical protein
MRYSPEQKEMIRRAIEAADATLAKPRPQIEPRVESRSERWRREADEQAARIAAARAEPWPLTEYEIAERERAARQVNAVEQQKEFFLQLLAELVAELRGEFDQKVAELNAEIGQLRAERTLDRALAKGETGDVVELPTLPLRRRA